MEPLPTEPRRRDFWPLTRLLIVGAALAAWYRPDWPVGAPLGRMAELGVGMLLVSGYAAQIYLALLLAPLLIAILLNDWLYDGAYGTLRRLGLAQGSRLTWTALLLEIVGFVLLGETLRRLLASAF